jgi:hypothetical protein
MARNTVQIGELRLRIPGVSREEAKRMGQDVAQRVSESLPARGRSEHLGAVDMRVSVQKGTPRDQIARLITRSILEKLR